MATSRPVVPFATGVDGDVLFTATTDEIDDPDVHTAEIATIASEVMWDALLTVTAPRETPSIAFTDVGQIDELHGDFEFGNGFDTRVRVVGSQGEIEIIGDRSVFGLPRGTCIRGEAHSDGRIVFEGNARRPLRDCAFVKSQGGVIDQIVVNLGTWQQVGNRR